MRHVAIDCRFAATPTGLGRFTRELATALLSATPSDVRWSILARPGQEPWEGLPDKTLSWITVDAGHYTLAEQRRLPRAVRLSGAQLLLSPHFNVPLWSPVPVVSTIHDLILHRYPNRASWLKQMAYRFLMGAAVNRSQHLLAVSPFVAEEIGRVYGAEATAKTTVIGEGVSDHFRPRPLEDQQRLRQKLGLNRPFLLYVGNAKEHKNVETLMRAFVAAGLPATELVLLSVGPEADRLHLLPGVRRLKGLDDADLPALYSAALACVTASLYEGFCLPLVEALACGCPVVASNATAIPGTVAGADGVALVEPTVTGLTPAFRQLPPRPTQQTRWGWSGPAQRVWHVLDECLAAISR